MFQLWKHNWCLLGSQVQERKHMDSWDILPLIPYTANTVMWTSLIIIKFRVMKECSDQLSPCVSYITRTVCSHILSVPRKLPKHSSHLECLAGQPQKHNPNCLRQILWHEYHSYTASKTQSMRTTIHAAAVTGKEPSGNMPHYLIRHALGHSLPQGGQRHCQEGQQGDFIKFFHSKPQSKSQNCHTATVFSHNPITIV